MIELGHNPVLLKKGKQLLIAENCLLFFTDILLEFKDTSAKAERS